MILIFIITLGVIISISYDIKVEKKKIEEKRRSEEAKRALEWEKKKRHWEKTISDAHIMLANSGYYVPNLVPPHPSEDNITETKKYTQDDYIRDLYISKNGSGFEQVEAECRVRHYEHGRNPYDYM